MLAELLVSHIATSPSIRLVGTRWKNVLTYQPVWFSRWEHDWPWFTAACNCTLVSFHPVPSHLHSSQQKHLLFWYKNLFFMQACPDAISKSIKIVGKCLVNKETHHGKMQARKCHINSLLSVLNDKRFCFCQGERSVIQLPLECVSSRSRTFSWYFGIFHMYT